MNSSRCINCLPSQKSLEDVCMEYKLRFKEISPCSRKEIQQDMKKLFPFLSDSQLSKVTMKCRKLGFMTSRYYFEDKQKGYMFYYVRDKKKTTLKKLIKR